MSNTERKYQIINSESVFNGKMFNINRDKVKLPTGQEQTRETLLHPGAVVILPKLEDSRLVLIKQYRHSVKKEIIEFPAGTLEKSEEITSCALRELREETGYGAKQIVSIGSYYPAPGFCNEIQHFFYADGLYQDKLESDEDEIIEVVYYSVEEFESLIRANEVIDSKSVAIYFKAKMLGHV